MRCRKKATLVSFLFVLYAALLYYFRFKEEKKIKYYITAKLICHVDIK